MMAGPLQALFKRRAKPANQRPVRRVFRLANSGNSSNETGATLSPLHEAAGEKRRQAKWQPHVSGPRREHQNNAIILRRSRDVWRNNALARGIINMLVSDTVVTGIHPILPQQYSQVTAFWNDWQANASPFAPHDFPAIQAHTMRALAVDGEVLVHLFDEGDSVALRVVESDCLASHVFSHNKSIKIQDGIETDMHGRRLAYHVTVAHPGDGDWDGSVERVPAKNMLHVYRCDRPGQIRGVPWLAPALPRLKLIDDLDDAQLERQRIANLFAAFIIKPEMGMHTPMSPVDGNDQNEDTPDSPEPLGLEPGILQELYNGEDIKFSQPPPPMADYAGYLQTEISIICAALGIPHQMLTGQFEGANDRVMRVLLTRYARQIDQIVNQILIPRLCMPVWRAVMDQARLSGTITASRKNIMRPQWPVPAWEYMHPVQDVQAKRLAMESGLVARHDLILQRGGNPAHVDNAITADPIQQAMMAAAQKAPIPTSTTENPPGEEA